MAITTYTTYGDIRAVLGVSIDELPDSVVSLGVYENALLVAMTGKSGIIDPDTEERNLVDQYTYLKAILVPTSADLRNIALIEQYAAYVVATTLCGSLSMFAPKTQADGKATLTRFSAEDTYQRVCIGIVAKLKAIIGELNDALGITVSSGAGLISAVEPDFDQVTGE